MATEPPFSFALVLGGGNALGAYQAGVYQALHEGGFHPNWVLGASAGAINGAIVAGNRVEDRLERLNAIWQPAPFAGSFLPGLEDARRTNAVVETLLFGRSNIFSPVGPLGSWWMPDASAASPALFDTGPLKRSLDQLVDFDLLNHGDTRFTATAVDLDTGEDVAFDTANDRVEVEHVRASAAMLTAYPAVEIGARAFVDAGLSANLPLDPVLAAPPPRPTLVVAVDLLPLSARRPATLGESASRMQDLIFAAQSRRTIERWQATYTATPPAHPITLARIAYNDGGEEVAGKALDFSPLSVRKRWDAGLRDGEALLAQLARVDVTGASPGLHLVPLAVPVLA